MDNSRNQPSKFKTKVWDEINDDLLGKYNNSNQIKLKTSISNSSSCDYNDAHIHIKETITISKMVWSNSKNDNNRVIFICLFVPFTDVIFRTNIT